MPPLLILGGFMKLKGSSSKHLLKLKEENKELKEQVKALNARIEEYEKIISCKDKLIDSTKESMESLRSLLTEGIKEAQEYKMGYAEAKRDATLAKEKYSQSMTDLLNQIRNTN